MKGRRDRMNLRALIFGGSGQLGSELVRLWKGEVSAPTRAEVDVADNAALDRAFLAAAPHIVINCTAYNRVDDSEDDPREAFRTNAFVVEAMARRSATLGIPFVTFSTDYVFDGTATRPYSESDAANPISAYGISKRCGELLVERLLSPAYIIRSCGIYGTRVSSSKGYTFIDRILSKARAGEELKIVSDQTLSPTYARDLARTTIALIERDAPYGIYHAVNEGAVSWYEFAREVLRQARITHPVSPVCSRDWPTKARRPAYSALENRNLHVAGMTMPKWRAGITAYLEVHREDR